MSKAATPRTAAAVAALERLLRARGLRLATAESCTGGWIAQACTARPGASDWFEGGAVVYSNAAKRQLLDVPRATLDSCGAVSRETVEALVAGLFARLPQAGAALAVSGVAGPGGGAPGKPVGAVWIAWGLRGAPAEARLFRFAGDRRAVREQAVIAGLEALARRLSG